MKSEKEIRELLKKLEEIEKKIDESHDINYTGVPIDEAGMCLKCGAVWFKYRDERYEGEECDHYDYHLEFSYMLYDNIVPAIKVLRWILGE